MNDKCEDCGSTKITYYRQKRKDGVIVVTARCENWHSPKHGKPFYPTYNFHLDELPMLPVKEIAPRPLTMLEQIYQDAKAEYEK
jgi:hypothetical protein